MATAPTVHFYEGEPCVYCRPCGVFHMLQQTPTPGDTQQTRWGWDGDIFTPTFYPNGLFKTIRPDGKTVRCHFSLVGGQLTYQPDTTHEYSGSTVPLLPPP